jgi:hypothetical protein
MSEIRCPRRECRKRRYDAVFKAFAITDEGGVIYGPLAYPHCINEETGRWSHPQFADMTGGKVTWVTDWDATRTVPPHFRCTCGHRWVYSNGRNETLRVNGGRVYDAFEVARLVKGQKAGWPREKVV